MSKFDVAVLVLALFGFSAYAAFIYAFYKLASKPEPHPYLRYSNNLIVFRRAAR